MATKIFAKVVFDRKKQVETRGEGKVEIYVYLGNGEKAYYSFRECNAIEWRSFQHSEELRKEVMLYNAIAQGMFERGEAMTIENYAAHMGMKMPKKDTDDRLKYIKSPTGFIDFIKDTLKTETLAVNTLKRRKVVMDTLIRADKLLKLSDLTPQNVYAFDQFLKSEAERMPRTLDAYHKVIKKYTHLLAQLSYIEKDPYDHPLCKFEKGKSKERKPLLEEELVKLRELTDLTTGEEHARDLFVFSAYTGLAYGDAQNFVFDDMAVKYDDTYYIDGERIKNGHAFFTPILPPAMEVLKKYDYKLPKMSNQKVNLYLHLVRDRAKIKKPMTSHVARHSFATLVLTHDVPIEKLARMMGHTNIRTTQIYGKILQKTIQQHTETLLTKLK